MAAVRVQVHLMVTAEPDEKTTNIRVLSIKEVDSSTKFYFPRGLQSIKEHPELFALKQINAACASLKKKGQYRNVKVTLGPEILPLYMDEEDNFVFKGSHLEEKPEEDENPENPLLEVMKKLLNTPQQKNEDICWVTKSFVLEPFKGKTENAEFWIRTFEEECHRCDVTSDEKKVEALRLFMEESGRDWFTSAHMKLSSPVNWRSYRESFLQTFSDKGWVNVRGAFNFKFLGGSLLEFALRKEKLLLEVDPNMATSTRIYLIVVGLPVYIQDRIDKDTITTKENLMGNLRKLESLVNKKPKIAIEKSSNLNKKIVRIEKKPCYICERLGKPERYHPTELCRNKNRHNEIKSVNNLEMEEKLNLEITDQKN